MTDLSLVAIIPLYNGAHWIEGTIRTVFAQTLQPDEFFVVDDGSTDGGAGAAIVARLAKERPITLLTKPNGGQSSARNFGVRRSKSALIALLDQDDVWYPHHVETLAAPFRKSWPVPLGWTYSNVDTVNEAGRMMTRGFLSDLPTQHPKRHLARCLGEDMMILPSASLISRAAFEAAGGFDERLSGYEDDDLFLRLFCAGYDNIYFEEPLSQWRVQGGSCGHSPRIFESSMIYMDKLLNDFPDDECIAHSYARDFIAPRFYQVLLSRYDQSLRVRNIAQCREIVDRLKRIVPLLRSRKIKTALQVALPLMRSPTTGKASLVMQWLLMRAYRVASA
jgi:glycosyltransferase involved in cell wall biosynthesis